MSFATLAQFKLNKLIAEASAAEIGRQVGSTGITVRMLASGLASPKAVTIERLKTLGIEPMDWFTAAPTVEATDRPARPRATTQTVLGRVEKQAANTKPPKPVSKSTDEILAESGVLDGYGRPGVVAKAAGISPDMTTDDILGSAGDDAR